MSSRGLRQVLGSSASTARSVWATESMKRIGPSMLLPSDSDIEAYLAQPEIAYAYTGLADIHIQNGSRSG